MSDTPPIIPASFASGVYRNFSLFRETKRFPDHMLVEVWLANGQSFICNGLWITHVEQVPGCVMIHGTPASSDDALVVREDHVISVKFSLKPPRGEDKHEPFGFAVGSSRERA